MGRETYIDFLINYLVRVFSLALIMVALFNFKANPILACGVGYFVAILMDRCFPLEGRL